MAPAILALAEPPHGHIVCRGCGRINHLALTQEDTVVLAGLSSRRPSGWTVDRIAYSLTAICPKCGSIAAA